MEGLRGKWEYTRAAQRGAFSDRSEGGEGTEEEKQSLAQIEKNESERFFVSLLPYGERPDQHIYALNEK